MSLSATGRLLLGRRLRQPDQRSCAAAVAVVAHGLRHDGYARRLLAGGEPLFAQEVLGMHRRLTSWATVTGAAQAPWPRWWGTPPWALATQVAWQDTPRRPLLARWSPAAAWAALVADLDAGVLVPVYVGSRWLPRHVVLALDRQEEVVRCYDPASGRTRELRRDAWQERRLAVAGWSTPWWVLTRRRRDPVTPSAPRTPA